MIAPAQTFDALIAAITNGIVMSCFVISFDLANRWQPKCLHGEQCSQSWALKSWALSRDQYLLVDAATCNGIHSLRISRMCLQSGHWKN